MYVPIFSEFVLDAAKIRKSGRWAVLLDVSIDFRQS